MRKICINLVLYKNRCVIPLILSLRRCFFGQECKISLIKGWNANYAPVECKTRFFSQIWILSKLGRKIIRKKLNAYIKLFGKKIDHVFILFVVLKSATGHLFIKILVPYQTPRQSQPWISSIRRRGNDKKTSST